MVDVLVVVTALIAGGASVALAQDQVMVPLADVARQAEAAKGAAKKAKKTYTNANLSADPRGEAATPPATAAAALVAAAAPVGAPSGKPAPATTTAAPSPAQAEGEVAKESEESWRARAASVRKQIDQMRERVAQLTVPNKLTDESPLLKKANDNEIANARSALDGLRKQWARLEASASERKVPTAWIEPQPVFPQ